MTADTSSQNNPGIESLTNDSEDAATVVANSSTDSQPDTEIPAAEAARVLGDSKPHAFIVMPFGKKEDRDKNLIDFDAVYEKLIKPAVVEAGFEPKRADEEFASGDIITDMFQELLLADLVIADMSIDNANVFYELGIRHALRRRGVVHIQAGRTQMPFDVFNVRTIQYTTPDAHTDEEAEQLLKDRHNLKRAITNTWKSDIDAIHSPVFNLLTGLQEPDRKQLATPLATGFWREQTEWEERIDIAQREKSVGDILFLTEEITNPLIKEDALTRSGLALDELGRKKLALKEFRKGLVMNPRNRHLKIEVARLQSQLGRVDAAIVRLERILIEQPDDTKAIRTLGRIYSDLWRERWRDVEPQNRRKKAFDAYHWLIKSINTYIDGFYSNLNEFEPGLKALILTEILSELTHEFNNEEPDSVATAICDQKYKLSSAVRVAIDAAARRDPNNYWVHSSLAVWQLFDAESDARSFRGFQNAVSHARGNLNFLKTSIRPLDTLIALKIKSDRADRARTVLQNEVNLIGKFGISKDDTRSIVFSGYSIYDQDKNDRSKFTKDQEKELIRRIEIELGAHQPGSFYGPSSHAFVNGVSGLGVMTFIECCLNRMMTVHIFLPLEEAKYFKDNLQDSKDRERYDRIKSRDGVNIRLQHERLGVKDNDTSNAYVRNTRWTVLSALQASGKGLHLIALTGSASDSGADQRSPVTSDDQMIDQCRDLGGSYTLISWQDLELLDLGKTKSQHPGKGAISIPKRVELLRRCKVLKNLHDIDLEVIARNCIECEFKKDAMVFKQNDFGTDSYFIYDGEFVIYDCEQEIDRRVDGHIVGEMSVFTHHVRSATVKAARATSTLKLSNDQFKTLVDNRPEIYSCLLELYQERADQLRQSRRKNKSTPVKVTPTSTPEPADAD